MEMTLSQLRSQIFKVFDGLLKTGDTLTIIRNGRRLKIVPEDRGSRLQKLKKRSGLKVPAAELPGISWDGEWKGDIS